MSGFSVLRTTVQVGYRSARISIATQLVKSQEVWFLFQQAELLPSEHQGPLLMMYNRSSEDLLLKN